MVQVLEVKTETVKVMPDEPAIGTFWEDKEGDVWVCAYDGTWRIARFKGAEPMTSAQRAGGGCVFPYVMETYGPLTEVPDPLATPEPTPVSAMVPEVAFAEWWAAACERNRMPHHMFDKATATFILAVHNADLAPDRTNFTDH